MKKKFVEKVKVLSIAKLAKNYYQIIFSSKEICKYAKAGQFINIKVPNTYLRRPFSFNKIGKNDFGILFKVVGEGTSTLSRAKVGDEFDVLGPLGNGYEVDDEAKRVLLIAGGCGIAPILCLLSQLPGKEKTTIYGVRDRKEVVCLEKIKKYSKNFHLFLKPEDLVNYFDQEKDNFDEIFVCGPMAMLAALKGKIGESKVKIYASLEARMACGVGTCLGCVCKAKDESGESQKRVCKDGPVFLLNNINFN